MPLVTTLEEVTEKPPKLAPLLIALERAAEAAFAAEDEVEIPAVGSAVASTKTELIFTDRMVII